MDHGSVRECPGDPGGLKTYGHFRDDARADIGALAYLAEGQVDFKMQS